MSDTRPGTLTLSPIRAARLLAGVAVVLLLLSVVGQFSRYYLGRGRLFGLVNLLDVDSEISFSTWFQSVLLLGCAVMLYMIARALRAAGGAHLLGWRAMSLIFLVLSIDEASQVHELAIEPLGEALHARGVLLFTWIVPAIALVGIFVIAYSRFLMDLDAATRRRFVVAGALYVAGAIGMEMVGGAWATSHGVDNPTYRMLIVTLEESLEAAGIVAFVYTLLSYMKAAVPQIGIRVTDQ